jgi:hypothetical protein
MDRQRKGGAQNADRIGKNSVKKRNKMIQMNQVQPQPKKVPPKHKTRLLQPKAALPKSGTTNPQPKIMQLKIEPTHIQPKMALLENMQLQPKIGIPKRRTIWLQPKMK